MIGGTVLVCLLRLSPDSIQEVQFVHQPAYLNTNFRFISQASLFYEADLGDSAELSAFNPSCAVESRSSVHSFSACYLIKSHSLTAASFQPAEILAHHSTSPLLQQSLLITC
jgi:hypothetical protein